LAFIFTLLIGGTVGIAVAEGRVEGRFQGNVLVALSGESVKHSPCNAVIESTGIGEAPRGRRVVQAKLLAERAAKVRAYRNLIRTVDRLSSVLVNGSGIVSATGFIRGARVVEKKYLPDGRVEVKVALDVSFLGSDSACERTIVRKMNSYGLPVYRVDRRVNEISEQDWIELNH
jgi:hypothetical protein